MSEPVSHLYKTILALRSEEESQKFFRDLLTEAEIKEFANRWKTAQMLNENIAYDVIATETGMSSTTIARISKWLHKGKGGYKLMIERMNTINNTNHHNTPPQAV